MAAIDNLVAYINDLLENAGGAQELADDLRRDVLPILSTARTEGIEEAIRQLEADTASWQAEPRWRDGKGDTRGPGVGHAVTRLRAMTQAAGER